MFSGTLEQDPIGYKVRGTNLYRLDYTANERYAGCRQCRLCVGRRHVVIGYAGKRHHERPPSCLLSSSPQLSLNNQPSQLSSSSTNSQQSHPHSQERYRSTTPDPRSYYPRIMFIGVAPRGTEDVSGVAYLGHEGRILKSILRLIPHNFEFYCTYLVACRTSSIIYNGEFTDQHSSLDTPQSVSIIEEDRHPTQGEITACAPHIFDIYSTFNPVLVVCLGKFVEKYTKFPKKSLLVLDSLEYITSLEYRLLTVRRNADKLSKAISLHKDKIYK
jgi:uracil-DNA glycosylase